MTRKIGSTMVVLLQGVLLFFSGFWVLLFLLFLLFKPSLSGFYTLLAWVCIIGFINIFYLRLNEVEIHGDSINSRNLFRRRRIGCKDNFSIEKTSLSPFIYKVVSSEGDFSYFVVDNGTFIEGMFSTDAEYVLSKLKKLISEA
jgi:hypothetical protein